LEIISWILYDFQKPGATGAQGKQVFQYNPVCDKINQIKAEGVKTA
jgi:hypothetical protein